MRPVCAPDAAIRIVSHQRRDSSCESVPGIPFPAFLDRVEAVWTGRFEPDVITAFEQLSEGSHVGAVWALGDIGSSPMINHHRNRHLVDEWAPFLTDIRLKIHQDMPPFVQTTNPP